MYAFLTPVYAFLTPEVNLFARRIFSAFLVLDFLVPKESLLYIHWALVVHSASISYFERNTWYGDHGLWEYFLNAASSISPLPSCSLFDLV